MRDFSEIVATGSAPTRTYIPVNPPRQPLEWAAADGLEANGRMLPFRVLENPEQYLVIGEIRYSDGRTFLDFGMRPTWIEANTDYRWFPESRFPIYVCPDCGGKDHEHHKISIPNPAGPGLVTVKCPKDARRSFGR